MLAHNMACSQLLSRDVHHRTPARAGFTLPRALPLLPEALFCESGCRESDAALHALLGILVLPLCPRYTRKLSIAYTYGNAADNQEPSNHKASSCMSPVSCCYRELDHDRHFSVFLGLSNLTNVQEFFHKGKQRPQR